MIKNESTTYDRKSHWVFLRGLARESRHWGGFPFELKSEVEKIVGPALVEALDLPGTGRYSEMKSPLSIQDITEFVREKLLESRAAKNERGANPIRFRVLVATSLGGMVASHWLENWPDDFQAAILINTSFSGISPFHHRLMPTAYLQVCKAIRAKTAMEREEAILRFVSNRPEVRKRAVAEWAKIQEDRPVSLENFVRQLFAASRYHAPNGAPKSPVLILKSRNDRLVSPRCSELIAERWGVEIRCHPSAGHDLTLDASEWATEQILDWLKEPLQNAFKK